MPYVYILKCGDGSYYTGSTVDLDRRLWAHQDAQGARYTVQRLPVSLVYCDTCDRIDDAYYREKQIQGWSRKKKEALIAGDGNRIPRIAECRNESHCRNKPAGLRQGDKSRHPLVPFDSAQGTTSSLSRSLSGVEGDERPNEILGQPSQQCGQPPRPRSHPRYAILALTAGGKKLAARLAPPLRAEVIDPREQGLAKALAEAWPRYDGFILIMAAGIAVRTIAPLLSGKRSDPGVVVMDEAGQFAVSLLSGHLGGANELARQAAAASGGLPVITTASDTLGLTAIDLWARRNSLALVHGSLTAASAALVNTGRITVFTDLPGSLPADCEAVASPAEAELIVSNRHLPGGKALAILCPRNLAMGIGCNRSTPVAEIEEAAVTTCRRHGLRFEAVARLASIDLKRDEEGLLGFAASHGLDFQWYDADLLNSVPGLTPSPAVLKATGAQGVAEPAALLAAGTNTLLIRKTKWNNVTIALAEIPTRLTAEYQ